MPRAEMWRAPVVCFPSRRTHSAYILFALLVARSISRVGAEEEASVATSEGYAMPPRTSTAGVMTPARGAEEEVASLLAEQSRPGALEIGQRRAEALAGIARTAAGVGADVARDVSDRAAARLKAAKLLKGEVIDDAVTRASAAVLEQQRLAAEVARTAAFQQIVRNILGEMLWIVGITAAVGGVLLTRRLLGWGGGSAIPGRNRVPTSAEEAEEEVRIKEELRAQAEQSRRAVEADQSPIHYADVAEMRRRGSGQRLGLMDQLVHLRRGVSSPEELAAMRAQKRNTELHRRHEAWKLKYEVAAAGCGAILGSLISLGVGATTAAGPNPYDAVSVPREQGVGWKSFSTVVGALLGTLGWLLVEPWAVHRFGLGPLGVQERADRERERNELPAAMRPREHRAGGMLQGENEDTNIDVMLEMLNGQAEGGMAGQRGGRRQKMPEWLKRKLLGQEEPETEPLPAVPGSVSAVRDRWKQQLREIDEMAAVGNPVTGSVRSAWDPVGIADPEWDDMVRKEATASRARGDDSQGGSMEDMQHANLYNTLFRQTRGNDVGLSWFNSWT